MTDNNLTANRHYPQPSPEHFLSEDVFRIRNGFNMLDSDVTQIFIEQNAIQRDVTQLSSSQQVTQAILSQNNLSNQQNQENKTLVSAGSSANWQHQMGFNRVESSSFDVKAGDRVYVTLSQAAICTAPVKVGLLEPFYVTNGRTSTADLSFKLPANANYSILPVIGDEAAIAGDEIVLSPGDTIALQCLKANTLEAI